MARRKRRSFADEGYLLDQSYGRQDWDDDPFNMDYRGYGHDETDDYFDSRYGRMDPDPFGRMDPDPFGDFGASDSKHVYEAGFAAKNALKWAESSAANARAKNCQEAIVHLNAAAVDLGTARAHQESLVEFKLDADAQESLARAGQSVADAVIEIVEKCTKSKSPRKR